MTEQTVVQRDSDVLTLGHALTPYECCGFIDLCADQDLMSLSFAGTNKFLDWLTWRPTLECIIRKYFLTWTRPEQVRAMMRLHEQMRMVEVCSGATVADPCGPSNGVEMGGCTFELRNFGRLRRHGPVRDVTMNAVKSCEAQPRYRLDGTIISDSRELDMRIILEVLMQDFQREIVLGNTLTDGDGEFEGLQQLIKTNYTTPAGQRCETMDSMIIDWNHNDMDGGAGITWNGVGQPDTADLVDFLRAIIRQIKQRISWAPMLAGRAPRVGDIVLMMPTFLTSCLLDMYACWSLCVNDVFTNHESVAFRNQLNGGLFGDGRIFIDGFEIPLVGYDWGTIQGPTTGDIYVLTGSWGGMRMLEGQFLDMRSVPSTFGTNASYQVTDGGKILSWTDYDQTCYRTTLEMRPRLLMWAPWAQARIQDVVCHPIGPVLGPDPCQSSYFPETSFAEGSCQ